MWQPACGQQVNIYGGLSARVCLLATVGVTAIQQPLLAVAFEATLAGF
jgi:hypothetical protein